MFLNKNFIYFNGVITYSPVRYYSGPGRFTNGQWTFKPLKNGTKKWMGHGPFRKNSLLTRAR